MPRTILTALFAILLNVPLFGQTDDEQKEHPIETRLERCLSADTNRSTLAKIECHKEAREGWDHLLNRYYGKLMDTLSTEQQKKLKASQRKWLTYRDKEFEFVFALYLNMEGTIWKVKAMDRKREIVKERALELKKYYKLATYQM